MMSVMNDKIQVLIDNEKCTGCGLCVADCQRKDLEIQNKKAVPLNKHCFICGHCLAICPEKAVKLNGLADEVWDLPNGPVFLDEKSLKTHLKFRRSVRQFKGIQVEKEKLEKIIEAGRLTPTASNAQNVRYIVIQNGINESEDAVLAQYRNPVGFSVPYTFIQDRLKRGFLFHEAPVVVLVISQFEINACLAAMSMELMAEAVGLGVVYVGLFTRPANVNNELRASLGIVEGESIAACLAMGYPDVKYFRSAPKKDAIVKWV